MNETTNEKHVAINRETMTFIGATMTMEGATILANLAPVDASTVILPLDLKSRFSKFGRLELMLLYKNTTGQANADGAIHDFGALVSQCYDLALALPLDQRSLFDLQKEHNSAFPGPLPKLPPQLAVPVIVRMNPGEVATYEPTPAAPKVPRAPSAPGAAPAKGSTGKVWTIADRVLIESGLVVGNKELRNKIIAACEAEGINAGTAATQYGKWKATK